MLPSHCAKLIHILTFRCTGHTGTALPHGTEKFFRQCHKPLPLVDEILLQFAQWPHFFPSVLSRSKFPIESNTLGGICPPVKFGFGSINL
jgi:hypothetical protein